MAMYPQPEGWHPQYQGAAPMAMYPQAYGQQAYGQMYMQQQQQMGQMGYPKMNPDGSFGGIYQPGSMAMGYAPGLQPGMLPSGFAAQPSSQKVKISGYLDDASHLQGWVLGQLSRVFHERDRALKVCIPSAALAAFFVIIAVVTVMDTVADVDAMQRQCKVLTTRAVKVLDSAGGATTPRYQPTVHVVVVGQSGEREATRYHNADDWEVKREQAEEYLGAFCIGCIVPCYEFDDGRIQLDEAPYVSIPSYIIMVIMLLSAIICSCIWLASGTFACCSPLITVTVQA